YEQVLRIDSEDADALLSLGRLALRKGDASGAKAYFQQLVSVAPDEAGARVNAAFAYLDAKHSQEALALVEGAIEKGTADGRVRFVHGLVLQDQRRWSAAAAAFALVAPDDGELYGSARMNLAYCLSQAGRHTEAIKALEEPRALRPHETRLVTMLA